MSRIHVIEVVGNSEGGGTNFVMTLIDSLDPARFALTLVAPEATWLADRCAAAGAAYVPMPFMASRSSHTVRTRLSHLLQETPGHVVHAHGTRAAWYTLHSFPRPRESAFFYSEHLFAFDARSGLASSPWRAVEHTLCRQADVLLTSCPANMRRVLALNWVPAARIGCDRVGFSAAQVHAQIAHPLSRAALRLPDDALVVGSVGRLIAQKGWTYLLRGFAEVLHTCPKTYLVAIGDGEERSRLASLAHKLGIAERVRFLGAQSNPWSWMVACDVIVLPSLWEGGWQTPLEALATGVPLIVSRVGGTEDYVADGRNGILVPPRDMRALADALGALLRDPAKRAAMRAAPRDILAEYDVRQVQRTIATLYERAASQHPRDVTRRGRPARPAWSTGLPL